MQESISLTPTPFHSRLGGGASSPALLLSGFTHTLSTRTCFTLLPRQGTGSFSPNTATGEGHRQLKCSHDPQMLLLGFFLFVFFLVFCFSSRRMPLSKDTGKSPALWTKQHRAPNRSLHETTAGKPILLPVTSEVLRWTTGHVTRVETTEVLT